MPFDAAAFTAPARRRKLGRAPSASAMTSHRRGRTRTSTRAFGGGLEREDVVRSHRAACALSVAAELPGSPKRIVSRVRRRRTGRAPRADASASAEANAAGSMGSSPRAISRPAALSPASTRVSVATVAYPSATAVAMCSRRASGLSGSARTPRSVQPPPCFANALDLVDVPTITRAALLEVPRRDSGGARSGGVGPAGGEGGSSDGGRGSGDGGEGGGDGAGSIATADAAMGSEMRRCAHLFPLPFLPGMAATFADYLGMAMLTPALPYWCADEAGMTPARVATWTGAITTAQPGAAMGNFAVGAARGRTGPPADRCSRRCWATSCCSRSSVRWRRDPGRGAIRLVAGASCPLGVGAHSSVQRAEDKAQTPRESTRTAQRLAGRRRGRRRRTRIRRDGVDDVAPLSAVSRAPRSSSRRRRQGSVEDQSRLTRPDDRRRGAQGGGGGWPRGGRGDVARGRASRWARRRLSQKERLAARGVGAARPKLALRA